MGAHFLTGWRSAMRAPEALPLLALFGALLALSPAVAAFGFEDGGALACSAALGTAALAAPLLGLAAGLRFASGDAGGEPLRRSLRAPHGAAAILAALAAGLAAPAAIASVALAVLARLVVPEAAAAPSHGEASAVAAVAAVAAIAALPAAAAGLLLASSLPRAPALATAGLLAAGAFAVPPGFPIPSAAVFLLARDAAFGELPPVAAALAAACALAFAAALVAAVTAVVRARGLAPVDPA
jgi:hypothetical protein